MVTHDLADESRRYCLNHGLDRWQAPVVGLWIFHRHGLLKSHATGSWLNMLDRPVLLANWRLVEGVHNRLITEHLYLQVAEEGGELLGPYWVKPWPSTRLEIHFHRDDLRLLAFDYYRFLLPQGLGGHRATLSLALG